jgi:hypothetical protein
LKKKSEQLRTNTVLFEQMLRSNFGFLIRIYKSESGILSWIQPLNKNLFREKYEKERKEKTALHHKFEVTKELLQKTSKEKKQLEGQLTASQPASLELQTLKRELVQVKDATYLKRIFLLVFNFTIQPLVVADSLVTIIS